MRQDTARLLRDYLRDTLVNLRNRIDKGFREDDTFEVLSSFFA